MMLIPFSVIEIWLGNKGESDRIGMTNFHFA